MKLLDRLKASVKHLFPAEGEVRPRWGIGELGGIFQLRDLEDGWQRNLTTDMRNRCGAVYACKMVIAQAIATMPIYHVRKLDNNGQEKILTSPLSRILNRPNTYQTRTDFFLNLTYEFFSDGNGYALLFRDAAGRATEWHLVPAMSTAPYHNRQDGTIYYAVGGNPLLEQEINWLAPASDVLHLRLNTDLSNPLHGISPLRYAAMAVGVNTAIGGNQASFFTNMSRPSGVLSTDEKLDGQKIEMLRQAWNARSRGLNAGEVPILSWGLKWQPMTITSQDAQLVEAYRMSIEDIARVYRVPLPLINDYSKATYNNTEQLISAWLATGLGFVMEHIEQGIAALFNLPQDQAVEFDPSVLLRTDFAARIDGLTKAIGGGLMSPNEARARENLPSVAYGDEPRVQAQNVPLSQIAMSESAPSAPSAPVDPPPSDDSAREAERAIRKMMEMS